ncbi:MAG: hypothetical protein C5B47_01575 [Verrucomicrobia bacterium]|nr:MAG: hypothetical protein C5B47_01575 [Verrucomicrobiota bacterium]
MGPFDFAHKSNPFPARRKNAFTLLEVTLCLALMGIFAGALAMCLHQIITFIGFASENARRCREFRAFCEVLALDCRKLVLEPALELRVPSPDGEGFSLLLFKRLTKGWEHSLIATPGIHSAILYAVQYRFHNNVLSRHLWNIPESLANFAADAPWSDILSREATILNQDLLKRVRQFQLSPIDALGRKQGQGSHGTPTTGLECTVVFQAKHRQSPSTFHARIPISKTEFQFFRNL